MPSHSKKKAKAPQKKAHHKPAAVKRSTAKRSSLASIPLIVAALIVLVAGFAAGRSSMKEEPAMLFVQQAVTGSFRPNGSGYLLTMIGIKPHTLIVSEGQKTMVGSWTNTDFITRWAKRPSAQATSHAVLLSHSPVDGKEYAVSVQLSNPEFDGPGGWFTYDAKVIKITGPDDLVISKDRYMEAFPEILRSPALFIDDNNGW